MRTHTLGFPRIGTDRELKKAVEAYWKGRISRDGLDRAAADIRLRNWTMQHEAGVDILPVGDFALYDHMLDMTLMLGAVPPRFLHGADAVAERYRPAQDVDLMFRMARGEDGACAVAPLEMTKWFDTNYHYLVPELDASTVFTPDASRLMGQLREALDAGFTPKAVLPGPLTWLWLAKSVDGVDRFDLLPALCEAYGTLLGEVCGLCPLVQLDEPLLALDLPDGVRELFPAVYGRLRAAVPGARLMVASYFAPCDDNLAIALNLPVEVLHLDLVRGASDLDRALGAIAAGQATPGIILSLGVVNGRNVWKVDAEAAVAVVRRALDVLGEARVWVATSCSLLHCPVDLASERSLDPEVAQWLAFARQKCFELRLVADIAADIAADVVEGVAPDFAPVLTPDAAPGIGSYAVPDVIPDVIPDGGAGITADAVEQGATGLASRTRSKAPTGAQAVAFAYIPPGVAQGAGVAPHRARHAAFAANRAACEARRGSPLIHDAAVASRVAAVTPGMERRSTPYAERVRVQRAALGLPVLPTTTIGSFPQTAEIRAARRAWREGSLSQEGYERSMRDAVAMMVREQEALDIDVLVHGEPERNDMVEYFGGLLRGFCITSGGWVQSYGTRCVKPPLLYGDVARTAPMTVDWSVYAQSLTRRPMKGMLTGPVTIACWSFVRDDVPRALVFRQLALALRDEVRDLEAAGLRVVQVDEPALREGLPLRRAEQAAYLDAAVAAFRLATSGVADGTQLHTHMCYCDFHDIIDRIADMDADVISLEASRSRMELLDVFATRAYPNEVGPGIYDIHSPRVPSVEEMEDLLRRAVKALPASRVWVNPDCGLKTRDWPETRAALANMVEAARRVRAAL